MTSENELSSSSLSSSFSESDSQSHSETVNSVLIPILGKEISHVQFRSLEEQLHRSMAALFDQKQRQGVVRLVGMKAPVSIFTPNVPDKAEKPARTKAYVEKLLQKWDFALPSHDATLQLASREKELEQRFSRTFTDDEPETYRRRIDA
jgi:hypothetical protein